SIGCAVELAGANTVSICDPMMSPQSNAAFTQAVAAKKIQVFENSHIDRLEQNAVALHRANPVRPNDPPEEISLANDLVLSFRGIERSLVDHLEVDHSMMKSIGVKMENTWDWKRYTWLAFAFVASGIFYYEKKTLYDSIGLGTMLGVIAVVVGGFYFIRSLMNGMEEMRFGGIKQKSIKEFFIGGIIAALGAWAFASHPLEIWGRSLGSWYPAIYSVLVISFGTKAIFRWRDSIQTKKYLALIFFQVFFFWILPEFIIRNWLSYTLVYAWPLVLAPHTIKSFLDPNFDAGLFYFWWGTGITVIVLPIFVALTGKKYCSWVCGCGGLAETVGDSFRHYSPKGKKNIEREGVLYWVTGIALVLTLVVGAMTIFKFDFAIGDTQFSTMLEKAYSWGVDWTLVSFVPIALYPFFGGKIWCRYWCPTALYMHVLSRFFTKKSIGYFRIDSDKDRCIACNMCSRYCEVGIDVMKYALKGQVLDNVTSSCIGCGVCISVCPTDTLWYGELKSGQIVQIAIPTIGAVTKP
ncbi:MAG TPA: 4Fe-4S dicluster-binding protein, partial [Candidatus Kapabacteria bacterium]|nr:4Fe-4S dicluster-binding protein [Candidatus Kapabacteria bacterium]